MYKQKSLTDTHTDVRSTNIPFICLDCQSLFGLSLMKINTEETDHFSGLYRAGYVLVKIFLMIWNLPYDNIAGGWYNMIEGPFIWWVPKCIVHLILWAANTNGCLRVFFQPALPLARQWCAAGKRSQSLTNSFITFLTKCNLLIMLCLLQLTLLDAGVQRLRLAKTKMLQQKHIQENCATCWNWQLF